MVDKSEKHNKNDFKEVALLHTAAINTGFISSLGLPFVSTLYHAISRCPYSRLYLDKADDGSLKGFLAGTVNVNKMYRWILPRYVLLFIPSLLFKGINSQIVKKIVETIKYGWLSTIEYDCRDSPSNVKAELLSIAVNSKLRRQGSGKKLSRLFEAYLIANQITSYKVVTVSEDIRTNLFYKNCGFILHCQFKHHQNTMNEYIKAISV